MEKVTIKRVAKTDNIYELKLNVTKGKVLSIVHSLQVSPSPVAADALFMIRQAVQDAGLKLEEFGFDPE